MRVLPMVEIYIWGESLMVPVLFLSRQMLLVEFKQSDPVRKAVSFSYSSSRLALKTACVLLWHHTEDQASSSLQLPIPLKLIFIVIAYSTDHYFVFVF